MMQDDKKYIMEDLLALIDFATKAVNSLARGDSLEDNHTNIELVDKLAEIVYHRVWPGTSEFIYEDEDEGLDD